MKNRRTGFWCIRVPTPNGRKRWVSTGEVSRRAAEKAVESTGVDRLLALANAGALRANTIALATQGKRFSVRDVIDEWKSDIEVEVSEGTRNCYLEIIERFFMEANGGARTVPDITKRDLDAFINAPNVVRSVRKLRLAAIRSFFRFAHGSGRLLSNPATMVKYRPVGLQLHQRQANAALPFTAEEYRRIVAGSEGFWKIATTFGWWLGYRLVDIALMERASLMKDSIVIFPKKTNRRLVLPLSDPLLGGDELRAAIEEAKAFSDDPVYCFPVQRYIRLDSARRHMLSMQFTRLLHKCDIRGRSFHGLRHSFKLRMDEAGAPVERTSRYMGHASIFMTEQYGRAALTAPQPSSLKPSDGAMTPASAGDSPPAFDDQ